MDINTASMASAAETSRLFRLPVELQRKIFSHLPVDLHVIAKDGDVMIERSDQEYRDLLRLDTVSWAFFYRSKEALYKARDERRICIVMDKRNVPCIESYHERKWWEQSTGKDIPDRHLTRFRAVEIVLPHVLQAQKTPAFSFNGVGAADVEHTAKTIRIRMERATLKELFRVTSLVWTTETFPRSPWLYAFHGMVRDHRDAEIMRRDARVAELYEKTPSRYSEKDSAPAIGTTMWGWQMKRLWEESDGNRAQDLDAWLLEAFVQMFTVDGTEIMQWTPDWKFVWQCSGKAADHAERLIIIWDERWVNKLGWMGMEKVRRTWPGQYHPDMVYYE